MNHEEFQRAIGADPTDLDEALRRHLAHCAECVAYYADVLSLETRLRAALEISVPYLIRRCWSADDVAIARHGGPDFMTVRRPRRTSI